MGLPQDLTPDPGLCFLLHHKAVRRQELGVDPESLPPALLPPPLPVTSTHQGKLVDLHIEPLHLPGGHSHPLLCLQVVAQPLQLGLPRWVPAVINLIHT